MQNYAKSKDDSYRYMFKKLLECFTYGLKLLHLYHIQSAGLLVGLQVG